MRKNILIFGQLYATQFIDISNQYTQLFDPNFYEVTVVYLLGPPNDAILQRHVANEVLFLNAPLASTRGLKIFAIRKMLKLHQQKDFRLVICHRYKPAYIMLWVQLFLKIPLLICVMHEFDTLRSWMRKLTVLALWRKNTYFAGVSNAVRDNLQKNILRVPSNQVITLYNALDVTETEKQLLTRCAARQELKLGESDFIFGTMGRLVPAKDHATLIHAFAEIEAECPQAKLIILGDGALKNELAKLIHELNLTEKVFLYGFIPLSFRLMKALDVFILSSIKEAFGRVLLEAMVAKIPIIATKIHGIPEVLGNTGALIEARHCAQLADCMRKHYFQKPKEHHNQKEASYQRVVQLFSMAPFKEFFWQLPFLRSEVRL